MLKKNFIRDRAVGSYLLSSRRSPLQSIVTSFLSVYFTSRPTHERQSRPRHSCTFFNASLFLFKFSVPYSPRLSMAEINKPGQSDRFQAQQVHFDSSAIRGNFIPLSDVPPRRHFHRESERHRSLRIQVSLSESEMGKLATMFVPSVSPSRAKKERSTLMFPFLGCLPRTPRLGSLAISPG